MRANAILKRLGFSPNDRAVIIHTDDIGMCEASVSAYAALHESGLKISGSTMVPCSWFPHAAAYCRARIENLRAFLHHDLRDKLHQPGVQVIGYRDLM